MFGLVQLIKYFKLPITLEYSTCETLSPHSLRNVELHLLVF